LQKAQAVERYLAETCEYSLDTPIVPNEQDAVLFFLTESRLGACDMFASAMALLLRVMDVPTRIATGFRQPEELSGPNARPDSASTPNPMSRRRMSGAPAAMGATLRAKPAVLWCASATLMPGSNISWKATTG
jgi:transglutaminase-like putative cysteine protease